MSTTKWAAILGQWTFGNEEQIFHGEPTTWTDQQGQPRQGYSLGTALCATRFTGGDIEATVRFDKISKESFCDLLFYFDPLTRSYVGAGLGGPNMYGIRQYNGKDLVHHASAGDRRNLVANQNYDLRVTLMGSRVRLHVGGVEVVTAVLPFPLTPSQCGIQCYDDAPIHVAKFRISSKRGRVFVVMQFSSPFNEIYNEVIQAVCAEPTFDLEAVNGSEIFGPGAIMADVLRDIVESEFVVAEITPANPNVYYELGWAHAIQKPVIMLANRADLQKLPFDIASSRVLFYEDSIVGRRLFEEGLRRHIRAILQMQTLPVRIPSTGI